MQFLCYKFFHDKRANAEMFQQKTTWALSQENLKDRLSQQGHVVALPLQDKWKFVKLVISYLWQVAIWLHISITKKLYRFFVGV